MQPKLEARDYIGLWAAPRPLPPHPALLAECGVGLHRATPARTSRSNSACRAATRRAQTWRSASACQGTTRRPPSTLTSRSNLLPLQLFTRAALLFCCGFASIDRSFSAAARGAREDDKKNGEAAVDAELMLGPAPAPALHRGGAKRGLADSLERSTSAAARDAREEDRKGKAAVDAPAATIERAHVGWPPVRIYGKKSLPGNGTSTQVETQGRSYVNVSIDGTSYLNQIDLKTYSSYEKLSLDLEKMFRCFITGNRSHLVQDQQYILTYEDEVSDWMLLGDLPWDLFTPTCRKLRISMRP